MRPRVKIQGENCVGTAAVVFRDLIYYALASAETLGDQQ
jgi:hypothetical protein